jgi:hypothetical protein
LFLILFHSGICVDFLGTYMISLVLFFRKPGVTAWSSGGIELVIGDCFEPHQAIVRGS